MAAPIHGVHPYRKWGLVVVYEPVSNFSVFMGDASGGEGVTSLPLPPKDLGRTVGDAHGIPMKQLREMRATRVDVSSLPVGAERRVLAYVPSTISESDWMRIRDRVIEMVVRVQPAKPHD